MLALGTSGALVVARALIPIHAGGDPSPKAVVADNAHQFEIVVEMATNDDGRLTKCDSDHLPKAEAKNFRPLPGVHYHLAASAVGKKLEDLKKGAPFIIAIGPAIQTTYGVSVKVFRV